MISADQIRASRAMLRWTQETLAERSGVSAIAIKKIEGGHVPKASTADKLRQALEGAGIEFLTSGVRLD